MQATPSTVNHQTSTDDEIAELEREAKRWELKHHFLYKLLMSPAVAAAVLALLGTVFTLVVSCENSSLQRRIEAEKQERTLIIEALKADQTKPLSRLDALVKAHLLPAHGEELQKILGEQNQNETAAPPN
jgi:hypothetical protein